MIRAQCHFIIMILSLWKQVSIALWYKNLVRDVRSKKHLQIISYNYNIQALTSKKLLYSLLTAYFSFNILHQYWWQSTFSNLIYQVDFSTIFLFRPRYINYFWRASHIQMLISSSSKNPELGFKNQLFCRSLTIKLIIDAKYSE